MYRIPKWIICIGLLLSINHIQAHEGEPNMAFSWTQGQIKLDVQRQSVAFGDFKAFVVPFSGTLTPFRMGDAGFTGFGFNLGGFIAYQYESTLLKWSPQRSQWLASGFKEQLVISRLGLDTVLSDTSGKLQQGIIANLGAITQFEAHPVFEMITKDGSLPDDGAFLLFLSMLGVDASTQQLVYGPSQPFALLLHINAQRSFDSGQFEAVLQTVPDITLNDYARMDALFDWAQSHYPQLFPHAADSQMLFGYYARCYDNGVCVGSRDGKVYTAGGALGTIQEQGALDIFYQLAGL